MPIYMCERTFASPLTVDGFGAAGQVLAPCLEARDVKWLASHLASDGRRSVCVFEAADAESVREANHTAGLPFDQIWAAQRFVP